MARRLPTRELLVFLVAILGAVVVGLASTDGARAQSPAPTAGAMADAGADDTTAAADPEPDAPLGDPATAVDDQPPTDNDSGTDTGTGSDTAAGTGSAPPPAEDPEAGLGDPPAGCPDQADPGSCAATSTDAGTGSTADPEAEHDDTPVGALDDTDLGGPIDVTDRPAADLRPSVPKPTSTKKQHRSTTKHKRSPASQRRSPRRRGHRRAARDRAPPAPSSPSPSPSPGDGGQGDDEQVSQALQGPAPIGVPSFFIDKFRIPPFLLPIYQAAGIEYGVRWEILAAINEIETDYGRNLDVSTAGAVGWMQFMPSTWKRYGVDANHDGKKDPYNPVDAIFAAARYLKAAGAGQDVRRAVFAYNHAGWYVNSVLLRARLIAGLPADLVGSLTDLTKGRFPVGAQARYAGDVNHTTIFAKAGSPVIAVQDGRIVRIGHTDRLGRFIELRDVYGNTYTYGNLGNLSIADPVPGEKTVSEANASASGLDRAASEARKERLFAHPRRPRAWAAGGEEQLLDAGSVIPGSTSSITKRLKPGSKVSAGTVLGRIGRTAPTTAPHILFAVRPAGRGAPRIDPRPLLAGWKRLESTAIYRAAGTNPFWGLDSSKNPSSGQSLLMSKEALQHRVLTDPAIDVYDCGRRDIKAGDIDRRVLATLEFLAAGGLKPTVTALHCGHSYLTTSGNVSEHSSGDAVDIAAINGIPILGHQGPGSITDIAIRRLLTLQGTMKPHQIISLMTFDGADNTLSLPDHDDHIHVGFQPRLGTDREGRDLDAALRPSQWTELIHRLSRIDNPTVPIQPSHDALDP
jgi:hypothetical protein